MKKLIIFYVLLLVLYFSGQIKAQNYGCPEEDQLCIDCRGDQVCIDCNKDKTCILNTRKVHCNGDPDCIAYETYCVNRERADIDPKDTDDWDYYLRQCVSYIAWKKGQGDEDDGIEIPSENMKGWGSGWDWDNWAIFEANNSAYSRRIVVNTTPKKGAIIQWNYGQYGEERKFRWGHVAYVEDVVDGNTVKISDYNGSGGYERFYQGDYDYKDDNGRPKVQFIHINPTADVKWLYTKECSGMLSPSFIQSNGSYEFKWVTPSPSKELVDNHGFSPWRLDIIKQDYYNISNENNLGLRTEASIIIPDEATSIRIKNGELNWNYRSEDGNHIHCGKFYFEAHRKYKWRIFNGKEYFEGPEFTCGMPETIVLNKMIDGKMAISADYLNVNPGFVIEKDTYKNYTNPITYPVKITLQGKNVIRVKEGVTLKPGIGLKIKGTIIPIPDSRIVSKDYQMEQLEPFSAQETSSISIHPNPSSDVVNITFRLEEAGDVKVEILDVMGRKIWGHEAKKQEIGTQKITWQAKNAERGLYFVHILANGKKEVRKVIIVN